jgi:uncharacterized integral membrane protein
MGKPLRKRRRHRFSLVERSKAGFAFVAVGVFLPLFLIPAALENTWILKFRSASWHVGLLQGLYPLGAIITGVLFSSIHLYFASRFLLAIVSILLFLPWAVAMAYCVDYGWREWTAMHTAISALLSVVLGPAMAMGAHNAAEQRRFQKWRRKMKAPRSRRPGTAQGSNTGRADKPRDCG